MSVRTTRMRGIAEASSNPVPLQCAHCRKPISEQESHKFLTDLLTAPNEDCVLVQNAEVSVLDALARVVGIRLLATHRILTSNQMCICESCHRLLQSLFQAYDSFCNKNSYIVINPGWKNEPCIPILRENSTQTDFTGDSKSQSATVADNDEIHIVDLDIDPLDDIELISPECEPEGGSSPSSSSTPLCNSTPPDANNVILAAVDVELSGIPSTASVIETATVESVSRGRGLLPIRRKQTSMEFYNHCGSRVPFVRIESSFRRLADLKIKESAKPDNNVEFFNRWYDSMSLPALNAKLTSRTNHNVLTSATPSTDEVAVIPPPNQAEAEPKTPSLTDLQSNIASALGLAPRTTSCELQSLNEKIGIRILRSKARVNYKELAADDDGADKDDDENEKVEPEGIRATHAEDDEDFVPQHNNGQYIEISQDVFEDTGSDIEITSSSESDADGEEGSDAGVTASTEAAKPIGTQCDYPDCPYSYLLFTLRNLFDHQLQVHGQLTQGALEAAEKSKTKIKLAREQRKEPSFCQARNCNHSFLTREGLARHSICHLPRPERRKAWAKLGMKKKFMCGVKDCWREFHSSTALASHRKKCHLEKESRSDGKEVMSVDKCENSMEKRDEINQTSVEGSDPDLGEDEENNTDEAEPEEVPCEYPDCSSSNLRFTLIGLARHQIKVHGQVTKSGVEASDKLKKRMAQLREQRIRNKRRRFICEAEGCGRSFSRRSHLDNHGIVHLPVEQKREARTRFKLKEKLFKCDAEDSDCFEKFGSLQALSTHKMIFHPEKVTESRYKKAKSNAKKFKCSSPLCEKSFRLRAELRRHEQSHLPPEIRQRRFACPSCKKSFQTCAYRNTHLIQIHSQARNHLCTECGKSYKSPSCLNKHMLSHANKRAYKCQECGATFNNSTTLRTHNSFVHTTQRLITCEICGKTFKSKINLNFHMAAHKNERAHKCPAPGCTAAFNYKHHLMQHLTGSGNHGLDKVDVNRYLKNPESIQLFKSS